MGKHKILALFICFVMVFSMVPDIMSNAMEAGDKIEFNGEKAYYNETNAESVSITLSLSKDGIPLVGNDADSTVLANLTVEVPYFDLALYGYQEFYRYKTDDVAQYVKDDGVIERPTALHAMIYILERYVEGRPVNKCGKGYLDMTPDKTIAIQDIFGNDANGSGQIMQGGGDPTSFHFGDFMGNGDNFMYYVNHSYPLMYAGWGATADYILLNDEDLLDIAMFSTNREFYVKGAFLYFKEQEYSLEQGENRVEELQFVSTGYDTKKYQYEGDGFNWYILDADGNIEEQGTSVDKEITFGSVLETGEYMLYVCEKTAGTGDAAYAPASAKITITEGVTIQKLEEQIQKMGTITLSDACEKEIEAIRKAYNALTDAQKTLLSEASYKKFVNAEEEYEKLKIAEEERKKEELAEKDRKAVAEAENKINVIGTVVYTNNSKALIDDARKTYDSLSENQKSMISASKLNLLVNAEKTYAMLQEYAEKEAQKVVALTTSKAQNLTATSKSGNKVTVAWAAVQNADNYLVKIQKNGKTVKTINTKELTYTYSNAPAGYTYTVVVTPTVTYEGVKYTGLEAQKSVTKQLAAPAIKVKKSGSKVKITAKKRSCTGYQVQISKKSTFSSKKSYKVKGKTLSKSVKVSTLKKGKNYVRVRAYTTYNGKTVYSKWSKTKTVKK